MRHGLRPLGVMVAFLIVAGCGAEEPPGAASSSGGDSRTIGIEPAVSTEELRALRAALPEREATRRARVEELLAQTEAALRVEGVALMRSDDAGERSRLLVLLAEDPSPQVRAGAASRLDLGESEVVLEPLLAALDDLDPEVVVAALRTLEMVGDASIVARLRPYHKHQDRSVRIAVVSAIDRLE